MSQDIFQAIADPTRRQIIDLLANRSLPINKVADNFDISRPAVSKHIKVLNKCGLLEIRKEGRKRYCRANPRKLQKIAEWTSQYQRFWSQSLDKLETVLKEEE